jgi:hypothetical protein
MNDKVNTDIPESEDKLAGPKGAKLACGIVMPISSQPGCTAEHWSEVRSIIEEAISSIDAPKFDAKLVSDADDVGVIQKRIVQNIYSSEIVVCDVSCKNANVMFELGMRLAFDKPTVIIKDDQTDYSFDTGIIEHLTYPRDLRFSKIILFKKALADKVRATYLASRDPQNSTFLKNFGTFHVATLSQADASPGQMALEILSEIQSDLSQLRSEVRRTPATRIRSTVIPRTESAEGGKRMYKLITEFSKKHSIKIASPLINDEKFVNWVESELPAGEFYSNRNEFLNALTTNLELYDIL